MNGRCLLDTNIIIALFAGDRAVVDQLRKTHEVLIPSIALGELYYGAQNSGRAAENLEKVNEFSDACVETW